MNREQVLQQAYQLLQSQDPVAAIGLIEPLLTNNPRDTQSLQLIVMALQAQGRFAKALHYLELWLSIEPRNIDVLVNAGSCCSNLGKLAEAARYFKSAIKLSPRNALAWSNLGFVYYQHQDYANAEKALVKAIGLDKRLALAHNNLGHTCLALNRWREARDSYRKALAIDPAIPDALSALVYTQRTLCDWSGIDEREAQLLAESGQRIRQGQATHIAPFSALFMRINGLQLREILQSYATRKAAQVEQLAPRKPSSPETVGRPLRIAYLSCAFRPHATCHLAHSLFAQHDTSHFELFSYAATAPDLNHEQVQSIQRHSRMTDLSGFSDRDAALRIQQDRIDILIDLDGHIESNRHMIAAYRPAPVQVNYLGFPGTMGAPWIDYIIGDHTVTPIGAEAEFLEHVVRMPGCYQFNNFRALAQPETPARKALGLPENDTVFCCFNIGRKIEPEVFNCWMQILEQVPGAVLWFVSDGPEMEENLRQRANEANIDPSRLVFAPRVPATEHLARQCCADLFLDTFFCSAHTTASDALWAGLPVITCEGESFANRVAASIVRAAGLEECVVKKRADYVALAIELGTATEKRQALKEKLAGKLNSSALFDSAAYTRQLERAYQQMWANHLAGAHQLIDLGPGD